MLDFSLFTYISTDRGNFYLDIDGDDPVQLAGDAKVVFQAFAGADTAGSLGSGSSGNPFYGADIKTVQKDGKITGFEYIKFAKDVTVGNMGAAFDGITIEGQGKASTTIAGPVTVNANDVTLKNLTVSGGLTIGASVTDFTAEGTNFDTLTLDGGGTDSVHLTNTTVGTINVDAKVRVVLNNTKVTTNVKVTVADAKIEIEGTSTVTTLDTDVDVAVEGLDKVETVTGTGSINEEDVDKIEGEKALAEAEAAVEELEAALEEYLTDLTSSGKKAVYEEALEAAVELVYEDDEAEEAKEGYEDLDTRIEEVKTALKKAEDEAAISKVKITLDGEEEYTNEEYDNDLTLGTDLKVKGTLAYHVTDPTDMNFPDNEHYFMVFTIKGLPTDEVEVTVEGLVAEEPSSTTYTINTSEVFVWAVEANEDIEITVKYGVAEEVYTLDLSGVTLEVVTGD